MKYFWHILLLVVIISSLVITFGNNDKYYDKVINYKGNNLLVSIDGVKSNELPSDGIYYLTEYKCGSKVTRINWDMYNHTLSISNGNREGSGVACNLTFESKPKLSSMKSGSYVKYVGNNGCSDSSCRGYNANYVNDDDMGYCYSEDNKYVVNGWRLLYSDLGTAYLVSAGGLECIKKGKNSDDVILFTNELNSKALLYCNKEYAFDGECNNYSARSITEEDFYKYLDMNIFDCLVNSSNRFCGYNNDLIDNGGYYWFASIYDSASNKLFSWNPVNRLVNSDNYVNEFGLRVIIRLKESVYVVSGDGTYANPYVISSK